MKGSLHFELENWKSAMELFNKTRSVIFVWREIVSYLLTCELDAETHAFQA